jgi:mycothiol synthase
VLRPAHAAELDPAIRLVLGGQAAGITDHHVSEFLAFANERAIDLGLLWIAEAAGKPLLAALPIISPGRTALLFASPPPSRPLDAILGQLIDAACQAISARDIHLAQALLDPTDEIMHRVYGGAGFERMAELIYLQGAPPPDVAPPVLPPHCRWATYSAATHDSFVQTIQASYQQSLDCPALNGLRDMADVIEGHKASGVFEPGHWFLLYQSDRPIGVLLLASSGRDAELMELVYLGLPPEARGRKLSEILIRQAMAVVAATKHQRLSLAVDERNVPALKLYYRHGMNRITSKLALMRDLRRGPGA